MPRPHDERRPRNEVRRGNRIVAVFARFGMTHIAINEYLDGKNVEWTDKVTEE
jgi:hypothetical protein